MKRKKKMKFFYRAGNEPGCTLKRWIHAVDSNNRFNRRATRTHWLGPAGLDTAGARTGGAGVARACVEKIPIDNPTLVKMPNGGIDMLGCVG